MFTFTFSGRQVAFNGCVCWSYRKSLGVLFSNAGGCGDGLSLASTHETAHTLFGDCTQAVKVQFHGLAYSSRDRLSSWIHHVA